MTNGATQAAAPDTEPARSRRRCRGLALTAGLRLEARFDCPDLCGQLQRKGKAAHLIPADQAVACTVLYIGPGQRLPDELPSRCVALNDGEASARQIKSGEQKAAIQSIIRNTYACFSLTNTQQ